MRTTVRRLCGHASGGPIAVDPSYPAFRFSAQDLNENNHRPFWTVDTIPQVNEGPPK